MVPPSVKTPTPEPAEVETRKVGLCGMGVGMVMVGEEGISNKALSFEEKNVLLLPGGHVTPWSLLPRWC